MGIESTFGLNGRVKANKQSFSIGEELSNILRKENTERTVDFDKINKTLCEGYNDTRAKRNNLLENSKLMYETQNDIFCEAFKNIVEKAIFIEESKKALLEDYIGEKTKTIYNRMVNENLLHSEGTEAYDTYLKPFVTCSNTIEDIISEYNGKEITPEMKTSTIEAVKACKETVENNPESETPLVEALQRRVNETVKQEKLITSNRESLMESCKGFNGTTLFSSLNYYHYKTLKTEDAELSEVEGDENVENKEDIKNEKEPKKCCSELRGFDSLEEEAFCRAFVDYTILEGLNTFNLCTFKNEDVRNLSKILFERTDRK